jgi:hypothetical protein
MERSEIRGTNPDTCTLICASLASATLARLIGSASVDLAFGEMPLSGESIMRIGIDFVAGIALVILVPAGMAEAQTNDQSVLCSGKITAATPAVRTAACSSVT